MSIHLNKAYQLRETDPKQCIALTQKSIDDEFYFDINSGPVTNQNIEAKYQDNFSVQLLALCSAQIEDYQQALLLLTQQLTSPIREIDKIRALNLIAFEIPKAVTE